MNEPTELDHAMADIVNAFLRWPLPQSVCADRCACDSSYPHPRSGTNLLTCPETVCMVQDVVRPIIERYLTAAHAKALEDGRRDWIAVDDRLPVAGETVFYRWVDRTFFGVFKTDPEPHFSSPGSCRLWCGKDYEHDKSTHWMPAPIPSAPATTGKGGTT